MIRSKHTFVLNTDSAVLLEADKDRISQVVIKLLNNAVKFSGGSKEIDLTIEEAGEVIQVCMRDRVSG